jgi:uncharacterized protein with HEPN domain
VSRADDARLDDIVAIGTEVASIVARGRSAYDADIALRRAVERCLELVGEASKALSESAPGRQGAVFGRRYSSMRTAARSATWGPITSWRNRRWSGCSS